MADFKAIIASNMMLKLISELATKDELETYVVGGFVRDALLERPLTDIDIVCIGSGIELAVALKERLGPSANLTVYQSFGTAAVTYQGEVVEFVGARKESYRKDSRKPIVENGSLQDDQNRRDFTINALAVSLLEHNLGQLIDPFDGVSDIKRKIIKTPLEPKITFSDDPLRMMRAVRFAAQLKFDIEANTFEGIRSMADRIDIVSKERVADELHKIVLSPVPSFGFKLLYHSDLLKHIFPEFEKLKGVSVRDGKGHKDNFYHTLQVLDNISEVTDELWLRWAAIMHDIAKPATQRFNKRAGWTFHGHEDLGAKWVPKIFRRMKLPLNDHMKYVQKLVKLHLRPIALVKEEVTDSAVRRLVFEAGDDIDDLMMLCRADITSKNHDKVRKYLANFGKVEQKIKEVEEMDRVRNFQNPVTGEDIMQLFNVEPSKIIGELKEEIKEAILEGVIPNEREAAIKLMRNIAQKKGLV
ncbi:MAG: HD domain-containing protein [Cyclobacteriaceae bacterium]